MPAELAVVFAFILNFTVVGVTTIPRPLETRTLDSKPVKSSRPPYLVDWRCVELRGQLRGFVVQIAALGIH